MSRTNRPRFNQFGGGWHAERLVMEQAKARGIVRIIVCRVGKQGNLLPIEPCAVCQKIADKLGIKLVTLPREVAVKP
jgi:cytidine deaminase